MMVEGDRMASTTIDADRKSGSYRGAGDAAVTSRDNHLFTIGAMARDFEISLRALRFYEDRGLLHPIRRGSTRFYTAADRQHLEMILRGKRLGFTLAEIHDLIHSRKDPDKLGDLESTLQPEQIIAQIRHLERQRDEIDEAIQALRRAHQKGLEGWTPHENGSSAAPPCEA
jgi:DNA-binding transcriptional MerR regulator